MNQMKFYIFFSNLLSTFFLFIPEGKTQQMLEGEIDLSEAPFALCQCAYSLINDPCRKNYEKWTIINGTSIHGFDKSEEEAHQSEISELSLTRRVKFLKKGTFVVLNLKNGTLPSINFSPKDVVIFCSQSIHQEVQKIEITNIKEIIFLPEAITERNRSLEIHFQNIKKSLYLPTNLFNYDYKIAEYDDSIISQMPLGETFVNGTSIYIQLYEVQGVYISSHSISAKSLLLKIDGAQFLTIEKTAVRNSEPDPLFSGFTLRNINTVKTECTWGSHLTIELCDTVYFEPNSLSESINTVFIANTNNMKSYERSFLYGNPKFSVILNVQLWEIIGRDDMILPAENSSIIESKIAAKQQLNTLVLNNTKVNFVNVEEQHLLIYKITISNSTFERRNNINFSLSVIAYDFNIEENQVFPDWIHLCQIRDSFVCENFHRFRNVCVIGFPYQLRDTITGEIMCQDVLLQYIPEIMIQIIIGGGFLLLIFLSIFCIILIYRYKKLSGKWSPDRRKGNLIPNRHSASFQQHQVIVLPSRDPEYRFNTFPRHFSRSLSPLSDESGFKYYTYYDNSATQTLENRENEENKSVQSVQNVELLHVNNDFEDNETTGQLRKGKSEPSVVVTKM